MTRSILLHTARNAALACVLCVLAGIAWTHSRHRDIPFEKRTIDLGASEALTLEFR